MSNMSKFSFMDAEASPPPLLPEGAVIARITNFQPTVSAQKETPGVNVSLRAEQAVEVTDADEYEAAQKTWTETWWLGSPGAESMTSRNLDAFGAEFKKGDTWASRFARAKGTTARAVLMHEQQGDYPARVRTKRFLPIE